MSAISSFKYQRPYKSIWSAFLVLFVVFGLFGVFYGPQDIFGPKSAWATNNYIDNVEFKDESGHHILQFHTKTSFTSGACYGCVGGYSGAFVGTSNAYYDWHYVGYWAFNDDPSFISPTPNCVGSWPIYTCDYIAGYTYKIQTDVLYNFYNGNPFYLTADKVLTTENYFTIDDKFFPSGDSITAYYQELPTLTITYPQDNDEIVNIFDITGSFTQPSGDTSHFLQADIMPTGTWVSSFQKFWTAIGDNTSGNFSITIGNVPSGYYDFRIYFISGAFDHYQGALISNIHIVNDLPPFLPPWANQPPSTAPPVYQVISTSTISTSTGLYTTLTDVFAPVILSIGENLTSFAQNFTQSNASSTGNQLGSSIVIVRSYISNINQFFSGFPLGNFLLLYLIALVVVIVLRLVKGLISLIKI